MPIRRADFQERANMVRLAREAVDFVKGDHANVRFAIYFSHSSANGNKASRRLLDHQIKERPQGHLALKTVFNV